MNLDYEHHKVACGKCGRKILVEISLFGVSHNCGVMATCADCLSVPVNDRFKREHSEVAADIEKWLQEKE